MVEIKEIMSDKHEGCKICREPTPRTLPLTSSVNSELDTLLV